MDPTPSPSPSTSISGTAASIEWSTVTLAALALAAALGLVWIIGLQLNRQYINSRERREDGHLAGRRTINVTLARVLALLGVAAFGLLGLVLDRLISTQGVVAAYFTLLGTVAGYLAGAKTTTATASESTAGLDSEGEPTRSETLRSEEPTLG